MVGDVDAVKEYCHHQGIVTTIMLPDLHAPEAPFVPLALRF